MLNRNKLKYIVPIVLIAVFCSSVSHAFFKVTKKNDTLKTTSRIVTFDDVQMVKQSDSLKFNAREQWVLDFLYANEFEFDFEKLLISLKNKAMELGANRIEINTFNPDKGGRGIYAEGSFYYSTSPVVNVKSVSRHVYILRRGQGNLSVQIDTNNVSLNFEKFKPNDYIDIMVSDTTIHTIDILVKKDKHTLKLNPNSDTYFILQKANSGGVTNNGVYMIAPKPYFIPIENLLLGELLLQNFNKISNP